MLKIKNLKKKLKNFSLQDISLDIAEKEYLVLLGPSGSGKTVFLEILSGVQKQDSGEIFLLEQNISNLVPEQRNIGLLYQNYMLFEHLSVFDNIAFSLQIKKVEKNKIEEEVTKIASTLKIAHLLTRYPHNLSGGEKQRAALARSLIMKPSILLLDEPFTAIDAHLREKIVQEVKKLHQTFNLTIIHVTHDIDEALYLADKIAVIKDGRIIQYGNKVSVFRNPTNKFVADFLGYKNIFRGRIKDSNIFSIYKNNKNPNLEKQFKPEDVIDVTLNSSHHNKESYILIPPESIVISNKAILSSARNRFKGIVSDIIQRNGYYELIVNIGVNLSVYITHESLGKLCLEKEAQCIISFKATSLRIY